MTILSVPIALVGWGLPEHMFWIRIQCIVFSRSILSRKCFDWEMINRIFFSHNLPGSSFWYIYIFFFNCTTNPVLESMLNLRHSYKTYIPTKFNFRYQLFYSTLFLFWANSTKIVFISIWQLGHTRPCQVNVASQHTKHSSHHTLSFNGGPHLFSYFFSSFL